MCRVLRRMEAAGRRSIGAACKEKAVLSMFAVQLAHVMRILAPVASFCC